MTHHFRLCQLRLGPREQGRLLPQRRLHHPGQPHYDPHRPPQEEPQGEERQAEAAAPGTIFSAVVRFYGSNLRFHNKDLV